ncbi:MAG: response regulator [Planctomycetia bacterium]|nr:response regulator [Planctomycetia bacterium]
MNQPRSSGGEQHDFQYPDTFHDPLGHEPAANRAHWTILVAEDDPYLRLALNRLLSETGFTVWLAADGEEALELYRRCGETIHVVLLDVHMPRRNGPRTLAALRALNPAVCCCFMSGALDDQEVHGLLAQGAVHCFRKPFGANELCGTLGELASSVGVGLGR